MASSAPISPCAGISTAARAFLSRSGTAQWTTVDLISPASLADLRAENTSAAAAGCWAVQTEVAAVVEDSVVGGVPVQWVAPRQIAGPEVVLFLYGGAFVVGKPEDDISITARLADHLCRRVCVPRYRLAPEHPFPAAREDALAVYRDLADGVPVLVVGESAGGNLAMGLVLEIHEESSLRSPKAVALLSPWADLTHSGDTHVYGEVIGLDPTLSIQHFLNPAAAAYAGDQPLDSAAVSPLFADWDSIDCPPVIISSATRDLLLSDAVRFARKLRAAGVTVELVVADGLWHVFEWYPDLPEAAESIKMIAAFLGKQLEA